MRIKKTPPNRLSSIQKGSRMTAELARFLRRIPQSNQAAKNLTELAPSLDAEFLRGYVTLLQTIGVVTLDNRGYVQASSQTAKYMLESLASFVEHQQPLVGDWQQRGIYDNDNPLTNAATLLHAMEQRRLDLFDSPRPARREEVAQVLIKRTNPETGTPELLFQYDVNARQYQLIGGRRKDNESITETIVREINEETGDSLVLGEDYILNLITDNLIPPLTLSPTFGALTEYHFWIYHMVDLKKDLMLQPEDRWVPIEQVTAGYVINDDNERVPFNVTDIYESMNQLIDGGFAGLPSSFRT